MINKILVLVVFGTFLAANNSESFAHEIFQDILKKQYTLKSISCKTCHPTSDRKLRTPLAERIYQQLKDKKLSDKYAVAKAKDDAAKEKDPKSVTKDKGAVVDFEKSIVKDFEAAFKVVSKQTFTVDEMIRFGMLQGARLDKKALEAMKKEKSTDAAKEK